jgi:hypothetical protein
MALTGGASIDALDHPRQRQHPVAAGIVGTAVKLLSDVRPLFRRAQHHRRLALAARQASNIAHESAHGLLLHPPTPALNDHGCRHWNQDIEDEADFLGPALLVPEAAALQIARRKIPLLQAATMYGVSTKLMQMRLNLTGAYRRVERMRMYS